MLPGPVAATTIPAGGGRRPRRGSPDPSPIVAVTMGIGSAAPLDGHDRPTRAPRARSSTTSPSATRPSRPALRLRNVSSAVACVFVTSSAGSIVPARTTATPAPTSDRSGRGHHGVAQVGRAVVAGVRGVPHRPGHDDRLRRVEDEVEQEARLLDRVGALDKDHAVDRRIGLQVADPSAPRKRSAKDQWLAGVRPWSTGTTSASASRPGVRARIAAPSRAGTAPPASGSTSMLIVPPVNTTATRFRPTTPLARRRRAPSSCIRHARDGSRAGPSPPGSPPSQTALNRPTRIDRRTRSGGASGSPSGPVSQRSASHASAPPAARYVPTRIAAGATRPRTTAPATVPRMTGGMYSWPA